MPINAGIAGLHEIVQHAIERAAPFARPVVEEAAVVKPARLA